jgi:hypothetical protein
LIPSLFRRIFSYFSALSSKASALELRGSAVETVIGTWDIYSPEWLAPFGVNGTGRGFVV